jgi:hypothetical protein
MPPDPAIAAIFLWAAGSLSAVVIALAAFIQRSQKPLPRILTEHDGHKPNWGVERARRLQAPYPRARRWRRS